MMKNIRYFLILLLGLTIFMPFVSAQIPEEITTSLQSGNAPLLAKHFNQNVELVVLENENVYSKAHAEQVISNFFKNNPPTRFSIIHQGGKGDSRYAIGTLHTQNQNFRVYFLIKTNNNISLIHQLRIEKQSD
jgi:hypothetical protein